eukprot:gene8083-biopygen3100
MNTPPSGCIYCRVLFTAHWVGENELTGRTLRKNTDNSQWYRQQRQGADVVTGRTCGERSLWRHAITAAFVGPGYETCVICPHAPVPPEALCLFVPPVHGEQDEAQDQRLPDTPTGKMESTHAQDPADQQREDDPLQELLDLLSDYNHRNA